MEAFEQVFELINKTNSSLLEMYPLSQDTINYTEFNGEDLLKMMD